MGILEYLLGYLMTWKLHSDALSNTDNRIMPFNHFWILTPKNVQEPSLLVVSFHSNPYSSDDGGRILHDNTSSMNLVVFACI